MFKYGISGNENVYIVQCPMADICSFSCCSVTCTKSEIKPSERKKRKGRKRKRKYFSYTRNLNMKLFHVTILSEQNDANTIYTL